ncbi:uncharacterized protein PG986_012310 [Apiospora aurea]|uniref:Seipin n=1 Tax=Apiospora aurea TaxID=335848 RepID=A0ABR1PZM3_9PEZI
MSLVAKKAIELVKRPIRLATAPTAQRAYINTFLFISTSVALLCIASLAYPIFYYSYVPKKVVSLPIHLQYNVAPNPYGLASLSHDLMLDTAYDVSVHLTLPRSPPNLGHGNFMVALVATRSVLEDPAQSWGPAALTTPVDPYVDILAAPGENVVFSSRRAALLPYEDPFISRASRALFLLWHVLVGSSSSSAGRITLDLPMGELVEFRDQLPLSLLLDVQAGPTLQVYAARVELVARLTGVRWLMYNHRIFSFVVCTALFWSAEVISMAAAWAVLIFCFSDNGGGDNGGVDGPRKPKGGNGDDDGDFREPPPPGQPTPSKGFGGSGAVAIASGKLKVEHANGRERQLAIKQEEEDEDRNWAGRDADGATDVVRARREKRPESNGNGGDRRVKEESVERGRQRPLSSLTTAVASSSSLGSPRQSKRQRGGAGGGAQETAAAANGDAYEDEGYDDEEYQDIGGSVGAGTGLSYGQGSDGLLRRRSSSSGKNPQR